MNDALTTLLPDAARGATTLAQCHQALAARRRQTAAGTPASRPPANTTERLLVAGLCAAYLLAMAANVIALLRA